MGVVTGGEKGASAEYGEDVQPVPSPVNSGLPLGCPTGLVCWNLLAYADLVCPRESLRMDVSLFQQGGGLGMGRLSPAADGSGDSLPRKLIAQHSGTLISRLCGDAA